MSSSSPVAGLRGTWISPSITAPTASVLIAIFIGHDRSAMWCSGPGKPTSVSSSSPVAGFNGFSG